MPLTAEERFQFDLTGFLVRPAVLTADQVGEIVEQITKIEHDADSLPPAHRQVPGGPSSLLIDHPAATDVLHEIIGPDVRLENAFHVYRTQGVANLHLHQGGRHQADPIFGYRVQDGRIYAGMVRVIFELTDVSRHDGATTFLPGSHKANFPLHDGLAQHPLLTSYDCPAGSAIFFTENLAHAGPTWNRPDPRIAVFHAYAHLATWFWRFPLPQEVMDSLPRSKQAWFREPWMWDYRGADFVQNTIERFIASGEQPPRLDRTLEELRGNGRA